MLSRTRPGIWVVECDRCLTRVVLGDVTREVATDDAMALGWVATPMRRGRGERAPEFSRWQCPRCETRGAVR